MKTFCRNKSSRVYSTPFIVHRPGTRAFRGSTRIRNPMVLNALRNTDIPVAQNPANRCAVCIRKLPRDRGYTIGSQSSESRIEGLLGQGSERSRDVVPSVVSGGCCDGGLGGLALDRSETLGFSLSSDVYCSTYGHIVLTMSICSVEDAVTR